MTINAKISCYCERSVVTLKLRKEYLNSDIQYTSVTPGKILNSLVYRTLFYVNIYGSFKLSKNSPVFLAHPVYRVLFGRYRLLKLPLSCEFVKKRWFLGPQFLGQGYTPDFGHTFSNLTHFRPEDRIAVKPKSADNYTVSQRSDPP